MSILLLFLIFEKESMVESANSMKSVEVSQESSSAFWGAIQNIGCSILNAFSKRDNPPSLIWEEKIIEEFSKLSLEDQMYFSDMLGIFLDMSDAYEVGEIKELFSALSADLEEQFDFAQFEWEDGRSKALNLRRRWNSKKEETIKSMNLSREEFAAVKKNVHNRVWKNTYEDSADFVAAFDGAFR